MGPSTFTVGTVIYFESLFPPFGYFYQFMTKGTLSWSRLRLVIYLLLEAAPEHAAVEAYAEGVGVVKMTSVSLSW